MTQALGLEMRFHVQVDGIDLGSWSSCKGLEVKVKLEEMFDPGDYSHKRILFADVEYGRVKLERAVDAAASPAVRAWLADKLSPWSQPGSLPSPLQMFAGAGTATITLLDAAWQAVCSWTLRNVYPSGWTGPTLSASSKNVAVEQLELAHEGFL
ncbi:phage tail protein [Actinophytocola sp.]|jgi:phage tail-like protein|uniref:phage tail protein n=1 Tax=Actinophytocola sp. TaxID=1872138 RepID=UPI002ED9FBAC